MFLLLNIFQKNKSAEQAPHFAIGRTYEALFVRERWFISFNKIND